MQSAAGLLLAYLIQYGAAVELRREEALATIGTALTEPAEVRSHLQNLEPVRRRRCRRLCLARLEVDLELILCTGLDLTFLLCLSALPSTTSGSWLLRWPPALAAAAIKSGLSFLP